MLCHSPPPFLHSTCITSSSLVHQTLMVLQASSGLEVETDLTVGFCNRERARLQLSFLSTLKVFMKRAITGLEAESDFIVGLCNRGTCAPAL